MKEELFVTGRNLPNIDPYLNIWHWQIPSYLFLGGLAAGILFFAGLFTLLGKEKEMPATVKWSTFLVPFALVIGLFFLFLDLKHKLYFWKLYTILRLESPMSWGAWVLMAITPISILWSASYLKELIPSWKWPFSFMDKLELWIIKNRKGIAWPMIILSVILGIYTGILLSAFNARPLWNTSILGPLFLTSGLSTGAAAIMLISKSHYERNLLNKIDILLIGIELFFIIHLFMGFLASTQVQIESAQLFLGGEYTFYFWGIVVGMGLILPLILEILEIRGLKIPTFISPMLILIGGLVFRFIIVDAGQITRYLY